MFRSYLTVVVAPIQTQASREFVDHGADLSWQISETSWAPVGHDVWWCACAVVRWCCGVAVCRCGEDGDGVIQR